MILVSDYDRTLYLSEEGISKNIEAIKKFRNSGNIFVIATGRSYYDFRKVLTKYDLPYDYVILNHGSTILDKQDNIIYNQEIDNEILPDLWEVLRLKKIDKYFCCSGFESRLSWDNNLTKIHVKYNNFDDVNYVANLLDEYFSNINYYCIMHSAIEIVSGKVNKSFSIKILLEKLNLVNEKVYTIGDGYTDISMIRDYNGYCMVSSIKELKNIAIKEYNSVSDLIYDLLEDNYEIK